ncbi:MAG: pyridoxal phosphate-dependent aminotransferase family protein [Nitrosopumilaceae archaeon]|nr:pyridoxal phosphate-dependent aminotransferase family protein [Nitrosopumilaceae archaeon]
MRHNFRHIDTEISQIKKDNLYRKFRYGKIHRSKITIKNKELLNLCSNDYLGIKSQNISLGQIQSSSRLVSGNDSIFFELEKKLAKHKSKSSALIYPTGYMANIGIISTLIKNDSIILSDEFNHASIIEACKLSGVKTIVYRHNDMNDLKSKLKTKAKNKFVITEGIFSMDGDFSNLKQVSEICKSEDASIILDDAHGDFVIGEDGKGTGKYFNIQKEIDVYISSLSKGLGSFGGYVASHNKIIEYCINKSKSFIYTSALPSILVQHALNQFESNREKQRKKLDKNKKLIQNGLKQSGYNIKSKTHIIPIVLGDEKTTLGFSKYLYDKGLFVQAIRYPTVPRNQARVRLSVTALLSVSEIHKALSIFDTAAKKFKI